MDPRLTSKNILYNKEVARFRKWALVRHDLGLTHENWLLDYDRWRVLKKSYRALFLSIPFEGWTQLTWDNIIFVLARDNETEELAGCLAEDLEMLIATAKQVLETDETEAKWQIAAKLGGTTETAKVEPLLMRFVIDKDEYVSRRALLSLSKIGSKHTETLAVKAWQTNLEYKRIVALHALHKINSPKLESYLALATSDERPFIVQTASQIEAQIEAMNRR